MKSIPCTVEYQPQGRFILEGNAMDMRDCYVYTEFYSWKYVRVKDFSIGGMILLDFVV